MILGEGQEGEALSYVNSVARSITAHDPHLADDLAQDVLLVALVNSPRNDESRRPWLRSITRNTLKYARFKNATQPRHSTNLDGDLDRVRGREVDPAQSLTQAEIKLRVQKLLLALPEEKREIVRLRAIDELSAKEVASRLGIPIETVRTRYRRSLATLREAADREAGDDALREWRVPAWFAWLWPKRAALSLIGLVSAVMVGAVVIWNQDAAQDGPGALLSPEGLRTVAARDTRVELGAPPVDGRASAGPVPTLADAGLPTDSGEAALSEKISLTVRVVDGEGQPTSEVEVYRLDDATNETERLGQTDAAGQLEARVPLSGSWVAARGVAGVSSSAEYLDQPMVHGQWGVLELVLEEHPVGWHEIRFPADVPPDSRVVVTRHDRPTTTTSQFISGGMHRSSAWLPPWRRPDGAYGVRPEQGVSFLALGADGQPWWISREHRSTHPLEAVLTAKLPFTAAGQLVDAQGLPLPGLDVYVVGGAAYGIMSRQATTDRDGRFQLAGCPEDRVRLRSEFGAQALARRPAEGDVHDIGQWKLRRVNLDVEAIGAPGPWRCTIFRTSIRKGLPELNPSLAAFTTQVIADSKFDRCHVEIPNSVVGGSILVEAGAGKDTRAVFVKRPERGWVDGPLSVDLSAAHTVRLQAQFPRDRFPVRAVWVEDEFHWTSPAQADPQSGSITSEPLPAGRWSLKLVDRFSLSARSSVQPVDTGGSYDFGVLPIDAGRARVSLPGRDSDSPGRGGMLRVTGVGSVFEATVLFKAGDLVPLDLMTELPAGQFRFTLTMKGQPGAIGEATIERGLITDVTLSSDRMFVALQCANVPQKSVPGASLKLLDSMGEELWGAPIPSQVGHVGETMWFTIPRFPNAQLCTERSDGTVIEDLLGQFDESGMILLRYEEWSGWKE